MLNIVDLYLNRQLGLLWMLTISGAFFRHNTIQFFAKIQRNAITTNPYAELPGT